MDKVPNVVIDNNQTIIRDSGPGRKLQERDNCAPLRANNSAGHNNMIVQKSRGYNKGGEKQDCPTITKNSFEHNNHVGNIRRLTEVECERLQGYPDDHTKYGLYPGKKITQQSFNNLSNEDKILRFATTQIKKIPKTQRYKLCGNAVTTKVVKLIAIKLKANS